MSNPLLEHADTRGGLPPFSRIRPEHVEPAVDRVLAENRRRLEELLAEAPPTWEGLVEPLEDLEERLERVWSPVSHLHAVMDSEPLRAAYKACLPKLTAYQTELGQDERLYRAYRALAEGPQWAGLDPARRRVVENALRDFRLAGVELDGPDKDRFKAIMQELASLGARFEENLLDATQAWSRHLTDPAPLAGLPESAKALLAQQARQRGLDGWLLTLELPAYLPVITYGEDRALRREVYEAYVTRASDAGPHAGRWDNGPLMERILALRHEAARLLGYRSYADYALVPRMAASPEQVLDFLRQLAGRSLDQARRELEELRRFAAERCGIEELEAWDVPYCSERLRQERYALSQEELRPYFPVPRVLEGLFGLVERLYGVEVRPREGVDVWHPDVRYFEIHDGTGALRGGFYLDLYARPHKRGGAWMDECIRRRRTREGLQHPVAFLTCNFNPPVDGRPALLTHEEVLTLFHEFGHGLHHMLTTVDHPAVAGIAGVPWDAVELPSQFMENWCWQREALDLISGHHETGEPLPQELLDRLLAARGFQAGMQMVRQLEFALFDLRLHLEYDPERGPRIHEILEEVRQEVAVMRPPSFQRFPHSFAHIFAGGYAAGYYSYKWAEVLSADAFGAFEEEGLFNRQTGLRFLHTILEQGGSRDPMELFVAFRGREPSIEPLLRHSGIGG